MGVKLDGDDVCVFVPARDLLVSILDHGRVGPLQGGGVGHRVGPVSIVCYLHWLGQT